MREKVAPSTLHPRGAIGELVMRASHENGFVPTVIVQLRCRRRGTQRRRRRPVVWGRNMCQTRLPDSLGQERVSSIASLQTNGREKFGFVKESSLRVVNRQKAFARCNFARATNEPPRSKTATIRLPCQLLSLFCNNYFLVLITCEKWLLVRRIFDPCPPLPRHTHFALLAFVSIWEIFGENVEIYGSIGLEMNRKGVRFGVEVIKEFVCMDVYEGV